MTNYAALIPEVSTPLWGAPPPSTLPGMLPKLRGGQPRPRYFRGYPKICGGLPRPQYFWECFRYSPNSAGTPKLQGAPPPSVLPGVPLLIREAAPPPILPGVPLILQGAALHPPSILPGVLPILLGEVIAKVSKERQIGGIPRKVSMASPNPGTSGVQHPPEVSRARPPPGVSGVPSGSAEGGGAPRSFWGTRGIIEGGPKSIEDRNRFSTNYFLCWVTRKTF